MLAMYTTLNNFLRSFPTRLFRRLLKRPVYIVGSMVVTSSVLASTLPDALADKTGTAGLTTSETVEAQQSNRRKALTRVQGMEQTNVDSRQGQSIWDIESEELVDISWETPGVDSQVQPAGFGLLKRKDTKRYQMDRVPVVDSGVESVIVPHHPFPDAAQSSRVVDSNMTNVGSGLSQTPDSSRRIVDDQPVVEPSDAELNPSGIVKDAVISSRGPSSQSHTLPTVTLETQDIVRESIRPEQPVVVGEVPHSSRKPDSETPSTVQKERADSGRGQQSTVAQFPNAGSRVPSERFPIQRREVPVEIPSENVVAVERDAEGEVAPPIQETIPPVSTFAGGPQPRVQGQHPFEASPTMSAPITRPTNAALQNPGTLPDVQDSQRGLASQSQISNQKQTGEPALGLAGSEPRPTVQDSSLPTSPQRDSRLDVASMDRRDPRHLIDDETRDSILRDPYYQDRYSEDRRSRDPYAQDRFYEDRYARDRYYEDRYLADRYYRDQAERERFYDRMDAERRARDAYTEGFRRAERELGNRQTESTLGLPTYFTESFTSQDAAASNYDPLVATTNLQEGPRRLPSSQEELPPQAAPSPSDVVGASVDEVFCDPCCNPLRFYTGAEAAILFPILSSSHASVIAADSIAQFQVDQGTASLEGNMSLSPRVWFGLQRGKWGVETRFFNFSNSEHIFSPEEPHSARNYSSMERIEAWTADVELYKRWCNCHGDDRRLSVGFRWADLESSNESTLDYFSSNTFALATALSSRKFSGPGVTIGLSGAHRSDLCCSEPDCCSVLKCYWGIRGSIIIADVVNYAHTDAYVFDPVLPAAATSINTGVGLGDDTAFMAEANLGLLYEHPLACTPATFFVRGGVEYQFWGSDGAFAAAGSTAFSNDVSISSYANSDDLNLQLIGGVLGFGFTW
jgi:hypothetical protein